jgi:hypothetical protein
MLAALGKEYFLFDDERLIKLRKMQAGVILYIILSISLACGSWLLNKYYNGN